MIPDLPASTGAPSQEGAPVAFGAPPAPCRVVFDTNVLLSLFVFADSRFAPLRHQVESGAWQAYTSPACLTEFRRVMARPMFGLDPAAQSGILTAWAAMAVSVASPIAAPPVPPATGDVPPLPRCRDADDQKFLELARDAGADWLVTADKALLKLARSARLRGRFRILTPEAALAGLATS